MLTYAQRLKQVMDKQDMTQVQLAEAAGVGRSAISQYLSGK